LTFVYHYQKENQQFIMENDYLNFNNYKNGIDIFSKEMMFKKMNLKLNISIFICIKKNYIIIIIDHNIVYISFPIYQMFFLQIEFEFFYNLQKTFSWISFKLSTYTYEINYNKIIVIIFLFTGMERLEFSWFWWNPDTQHWCAGIQRCCTQQFIYSTGMHAVSSGTDDWKVSH